MCLIFVISNATPCVFAQKGSVIVIQTKGVVEAYSPQGRKLTAPVVRGSVLPVGYSIKTGLFAESTLLLSNGTTAILQENSKLRLDKFEQAPFDAKAGSFSQIQAEPSTSQVSIDMEIGSLVVQTKKLNKASSFSISTPVGTAGIRGTQFQMAMSPNTGMKLDVAESQVAFTPAGQAQPVVVGPGKGLDASSSGVVKQRPISPSAAQNINVKNSAANSVCGTVPVALAKQANAKAQKASENQAGDNSSDDSESKSDDSSEDAEDDKQASSESSSKSDAAESFVGRSSSVTSRNISSAEIQRVSKEVREQKEKDLKASIASDSSMPPPPNVIPPGPPSSSPEIGNSVRYAHDPVEELLTIGIYQDNFEFPVDVLYLDLDDLTGGDDDYKIILSLFDNWDADDETKLFHSIGVDVFIQEIGLNPTKYDDFNVAVQHAISLAQSFMETITLSTIMPGGQVRNAQNLVDEFANNPYAFEFAKLLAKHGAISNPSNQQATNNLLAILGSEKLSDANYLSTILGQTLVPGDSYNSQELNGGLIGARNASIDSKTAEQLQVRLQNVQALGRG